MPPNNQNPKHAHISPNVFKHIIDGLRTVFSVNPLTTILAFAISNVLIISTIILLFFTVVLDFIETRATASISKTFLLVGCIAALTVVAIYAYLIVLYPIISSMYGRRVTLMTSLRRALMRLPGITLFWFLVVILYAVCVTILTVLMDTNATAGSIGGLVLLTIAISILLRVLYTPMLLIDDIPSEGLLAALQRSRELWKRSRAALILYFFVIVLLVFGGFAAFSATNTAASQDEETTVSAQEVPAGEAEDEGTTSEEGVEDAVVEDSEKGGSIVAAFGGAIVVYSLLTVVFSALVSIFMTSAVARIYQLARQLADGIDMAADIAQSPAFTQGTWPIGPNPPSLPAPPPGNFFYQQPPQSQVPASQQETLAPYYEAPASQPLQQPYEAPSVPPPEQATIYTPPLPESQTPVEAPMSPPFPEIPPQQTPEPFDMPPPPDSPNYPEESQEFVQVIPHDNEPRQQ